MKNFYDMKAFQGWIKKNKMFTNLYTPRQRSIATLAWEEAIRWVLSIKEKGTSNVEFIDPKKLKKELNE